MSPRTAKSGRGPGADQKLILWLVAVMALLIAGVMLLAPSQEADDPTPTSTNNGPLGAKAAYLTLEGLGHKMSRWQKPLGEMNDALSDAQAANTTLVLIEPIFDATQESELKAQLARFLNRGGRLLTTGHSGALLLGAKTDTPELLEALCLTQPHGESALARAGKVQMSNRGGWGVTDEKTADGHAEVAEQCGKNAVVVKVKVGRGVVVWWSSETPIVDVELKKDSALKLLLASVDEGQYSDNQPPRDVVFDEAMHAAVRSKWAATKGLPIAWVSIQAALVFLLVVLSFSRRRGPVRMPVVLPRSSPVEFATSMGDLYQKGEASSAVTESAKRRLLRVLMHDVGLAQETIAAGPEAVALALEQRLVAVAKPLAMDVAAHLRDAAEASHAKISPKSTLKLAQALCEDAERLREAIAPAASKEVEEVATKE